MRNLGSSPVRCYAPRKNSWTIRCGKRTTYIPWHSFRILSYLRVHGRHWHPYKHTWNWGTMNARCFQWHSTIILQVCDSVFFSLFLWPNPSSDYSFLKWLLRRPWSQGSSGALAQWNDRIYLSSFPAPERCWTLEYEWPRQLPKRHLTRPRTSWRKKPAPCPVCRWYLSTIGKYCCSIPKAQRISRTHQHSHGISPPMGNISFLFTSISLPCSVDQSNFIFWIMALMPTRWCLFLFCYELLPVHLRDIFQLSNAPYELKGLSSFEWKTWSSTRRTGWRAWRTLRLFCLGYTIYKIHYICRFYYVVVYWLYYRIRNNISRLCCVS